MPYHIEHQGNNYNVVVDATGKVVGRHPSRVQAQAQLGALYANVPDAKIKKCMTCGCDDLGNDHHYISDTEKCAYCIDKAQGPCWDGYSYAGTKEQNGKTVPNCVPIKKQMITGGEGWTIEFSTPDCQNGWAILKGGTAQSLGCYMTKKAAEEALAGLQNEKIDILSDEVRTTKTPEEFKSKNKVQINKLGASNVESGISFWDGIFVPEGEALSGVNYGTIMQDDRYYFPSKASYENDGKPSAGYGNRSSNESIPEGNYTPDKTTRPYEDNK